MAWGFQKYGEDVRSMLRIAVPLAFAELGWMAMAVVDSIMVGRLPDSAVAIGATSIGGSLFYGFAIFGIGLMSGLDTLVSHAYGADDWSEARRSLIGGLALAMCSAPVLMALILGAGPLLGVIGVQSPVREQAVSFAGILVWSLPLLLIYTTFRRYLQGIHYVKPVTFALITSNLVNLFGNWILIFGHWGAPAMGIRGSAFATVIARIYLAAVLLIAVCQRDPLAFRGARLDLSHVVRLLRLGLPAALTIGFEVGVFNTVTALTGKLSPASVAAHAIALNAASVSYMIPLGIASAAAVSVGKQLGAKNRTHAARAGWTAVAVGAALELVAAALFVFLPRQIAQVYTPDNEVILLSIILLRIAAVFQLFDGLQAVTTGALRGAGNTRTAMIWNLVSYWGIGLPIGCWLCFVLGWGVAGLWWGLCLGLVLIGAGLLRVWQNEARKMQAQTT